MNSISAASDREVRVETWKDAIGADDVDMLAAVLHACVHAGASVSFVLPFSHQDARAFWSGQILHEVATGNRRLLVARSGGNIVGTVQIDLATPPNQSHRGEVKKLLVHPEARRRGIARSLMVAVEVEALRAQRTLLTLDTVTGGVAESLYLSLGYMVVGAIPGYALNFDSSVLESTTVMYKNLSGPPLLKVTPLRGLA
jgi:ribosomal protein S18 acetylase RimI-like enzyme